MARSAGIDPESIIVVGDRVDLVVETGQVYRVLIEDRIDNGPFLIAVPTSKGIPMHVARDDEIFLVFYRESGRYIAQMSVVGMENRDGIRYMWLLQRTQAQKNQRRDAYRLPVGFTVRMCEYDEELEQKILCGGTNLPEMTAREKASGVDISITGLSVMTHSQYEPGEMFILELQLNRHQTHNTGVRSRHTSKPILLTAAVKRSVPAKVSGRFTTGMKFMGITRSVSDDIAQFVLAEQQRQIKMRRHGR